MVSYKHQQIKTCLRAGESVSYVLQANRIVSVWKTLVAIQIAIVCDWKTKNSSLKTFIQAVKCPFYMQMHHLICEIWSGSTRVQISLHTHDMSLDRSVRPHMICASVMAKILVIILAMFLFCCCCWCMAWHDVHVIIWSMHSFVLVHQVTTQSSLL